MNRLHLLVVIFFENTEVAKAAQMEPVFVRDIYFKTFAENYGMDKKKIKKQMAYADAKNCPFVILIGANEAEKGIATVKNLKLGKEIADKFTDKKEWMEQVQKEVPIAELSDYLKEQM